MSKHSNSDLPTYAFWPQNRRFCECSYQHLKLNLNTLLTLPNMYTHYQHSIHTLPTYAFLGSKSTILWMLVPTLKTQSTHSTNTPQHVQTLPTLNSHFTNICIFDPKIDDFVNVCTNTHTSIYTLYQHSQTCVNTFNTQTPLYQRMHFRSQNWWFRECLHQHSKLIPHTLPTLSNMY